MHTEREDLLNALLRFEGGAVGVLQVNWLTPTKIRELSVLGERGLFVVDYLTQELTHFKNADVEAGREALPNLRSVSEGEMVRFPITQAEPLKLELMSFLDAVREGRPVEVDGEAGMRALLLAFGPVKSAADGPASGRGEPPAAPAGAACFRTLHTAPHRSGDHNKYRRP